MKILITTDIFFVKTNGVYISVRNLCGELEKDGHEVKILTLSQNKRSRREGNTYYIRSVSLERVYPGVRMPTSYRHRLIRDLIQWKPDVIHSQCEFFTFQYAKRIARHTGAPIVHTYHSLYEQYFPYLLPSRALGDRVVSTFSRVRLKNAKCVIAPTRKVEVALRGYGLNTPIRIVPSGIDLTQHSKQITKEDRNILRSNLGITQDQFVLLSLGRLGIEKNVDELIRLFAEARKHHENIIFLIVGDGPARTSLELLCTELKLIDSVKFIGMVDPANVQNYYKLSDLFVGASTSETQGLTFVEAAANGLPLLCKDDPCLQDVLINGRNGYLFSTQTEFLDALECIIDNIQWRADASTASRELARNFDQHAFGKSVEAIYESLVK